MDHLNANKLRDITTERVEKFLSPTEWTDVNLFSTLYPKKCSNSVQLKVYSITDFDPNETDKVTYEDAIKGTYRDAKIGEHFGPSWSTHWFKGMKLFSLKIDFANLF